MSLETTLPDITARLRQGRFPNEQAISQGIVLRILQELGGTRGTQVLSGLNIRLARGALISLFAIQPLSPLYSSRSNSLAKQRMPFGKHLNMPFTLVCHLWCLPMAERGVFISQPSRAATKIAVFINSICSNVPPGRQLPDLICIWLELESSRAKHLIHREKNIEAAIANPKLARLSQMPGGSWLRKVTSFSSSYLPAQLSRRPAFVLMMTMPLSI
jgi:hypothetical protein